MQIFIVSFPVWAGIKSSKLSYIDNSISCCVSMQHFITNKTQTTILEKTLNKNGNTSIPTIYKGQLTPEENDKKLGIRLRHIFYSISCGVCMPHSIIENERELLFKGKLQIKILFENMLYTYEGQLQTDIDDRKLGCRFSHTLVIQFPVLCICHTSS